MLPAISINKGFTAIKLLPPPPMVSLRELRMERNRLPFAKPSATEASPNGAP